MHLQDGLEPARRVLVGDGTGEQLTLPERLGDRRAAERREGEVVLEDVARLPGTAALRRNLSDDDARIRDERETFCEFRDACGRRPLERREGSAGRGDRNGLAVAHAGGVLV